jgi:hypothetical protein
MVCRLPILFDRHDRIDFTFQDLKMHAIKLSLEKDPFSTIQVDIELYKVAFVYTDSLGDKFKILSDTDLADACSEFRTVGGVTIFASVENMKVKKESPTTLESATESSTQTAHSVASITTTPTPETSDFIKLALAGSGGKKVDSTPSLKNRKAQYLAPTTLHDTLMAPTCVARRMKRIRLRLRLRLRFDTSRTMNSHLFCTAFLVFPDDTIFCSIPIHVESNTHLDFKKLERHAMLLMLGKDPTSTRHAGLYNQMRPYEITFFYNDVDGDKVMIASDSHLQFAIRQFKTKGVPVKIFASFQKKKDEKEESPTLESATGTHSVTTTSINPPGTHKMVTYIVKLALVGSGGKKSD